MEVVFSAAAERDVDELFYWIAERAGPRVAMGYPDRLRARCAAIGALPFGARIRDDIDPDVRIVGFEGRTNIAYVISGDHVVIISIDHGGRLYRRR